MAQHHSVSELLRHHYANSLIQPPTDATTEKLKRIGIKLESKVQELEAMKAKKNEVVKAKKAERKRIKHTMSSAEAACRSSLSQDSCLRHTSKRLRGEDGQHSLDTRGAQKQLWNRGTTHA